MWQLSSADQWPKKKLANQPRTCKSSLLVLLCTASPSGMIHNTWSQSCCHIETGRQSPAGCPRSHLRLPQGRWSWWRWPGSSGYRFYTHETTNANTSNSLPGRPVNGNRRSYPLKTSPNDPFPILSNFVKSFSGSASLSYLKSPPFTLFCDRSNQTFVTESWTNAWHKQRPLTIDMLLLQNHAKLCVHGKYPKARDRFPQT